MYRQIHVHLICRVNLNCSSLSFTAKNAITAAWDFKDSYIPVSDWPLDGFFNSEKKKKKKHFMCSEMELKRFNTFLSIDMVIYKGLFFWFL